MIGYLHACVEALHHLLSSFFCLLAGSSAFGGSALNINFMSIDLAKIEAEVESAKEKEMEDKNKVLTIYSLPFISPPPYNDTITIIIP